MYGKSFEPGERLATGKTQKKADVKKQKRKKDSRIRWNRRRAGGGKVAN